MPISSGTKKTATPCGAAAIRNYRAILFAVLVAEQILCWLILLDAGVAAWRLQEAVVVLVVVYCRYFANHTVATL